MKLKDSHIKRLTNVLQSVFPTYLELESCLIQEAGVSLPRIISPNLGTDQTYPLLIAQANAESWAFVLVELAYERSPNHDSADFLSYTYREQINLYRVQGDPDLTTQQRIAFIKSKRAGSKPSNQPVEIGRKLTITVEHPNQKGIRVENHQAGSEEVVLRTELGVSDLQRATMEMFGSLIDRNYLNERQHLSVIGEHLFQALFSSQTTTLLHQELNAAGQDQYLHIQVEFIDEMGELAAYPWEYLYDKSLDRHLALHPRVVFSRSQAGRMAERPLQSEPLRLMFVIGNAPSLPVIEVEKLLLELAVVLPEVELGIVGISAETLTHLQTPATIAHHLPARRIRQLVTQQRLGKTPSTSEIAQRIGRLHLLNETATYSGLEFALHTFRPHVLHFNCYEQTKSNGAPRIGLAPEDGAASGPFWCDAQTLRECLSDTMQAPRLVTFEGQSLTSDQTALFAQFSAELMTTGLQNNQIAAALALKYPLTEPTRINFWQRFYIALSQTASVDVATQLARSTISKPVRNRNFGAPLLFRNSYQAAHVIAPTINEVEESSQSILRQINRSHTPETHQPEHDSLFEDTPQSKGAPILNANLSPLGHKLLAAGERELANLSAKQRTFARLALEHFADEQLGLSRKEIEQLIFSEVRNPANAEIRSVFTEMLYAIEPDNGAAS